ncbi:MAG: PH domain-containing protein [Nitriliruptor sp.]|uniref:PH domain-containing protein n=1 Tax=Nitriliruptor sp. TaxID=2448056 RepID=UPI00349FF8E8
MWRVSGAIGLLVPAAVLSAIGVVLLGRVGVAVAVLIVPLSVAFVLWYPRARYDRWRWRLTDLAVELDRGVVVRQAEALPYFRIQQIDVNQGPVDRLLGLASLQVTSASASGSVTLPGIAADQAPGVRRVLLARAAAAVGGRVDGVQDAV